MQKRHPLKTGREPENQNFTVASRPDLNEKTGGHVKNTHFSL
jgi:hypothetical protein